MCQKRWRFPVRIPLDLEPEAGTLVAHALTMPVLDRSDNVGRRLIVKHHGENVLLVPKKACRNLRILIWQMDVVHMHDHARSEKRVDSQEEMRRVAAMEQEMAAIQHQHIATLQRLKVGRVNIEEAVRNPLIRNVADA